MFVKWTLEILLQTDLIQRMNNEYASSVVNNNVRQREDNLYVISQKSHYRTEVEKLHDSLSKGPVVSRTRSGRAQ